MGERYVRDMLVADGWDADRMRRDWYYAFRFLLSRIYYQGRNDTLSERYFKAMVSCLDRTFEENADARLKALQHEHAIPVDASWTDFDRQRSSLWRQFDASMGKERDREMVLDTLRYVCGLDAHNIVNRSLSAIEQGLLRSHQSELQTIRQVGTKTSAFYLRDLVFLCSCRISAADALALQPVDTWVRQVVDIARGGQPEANPISSDVWLVQEASGRFDPSLLNAGAWYLGKHSFRVLLALTASGAIAPEALKSVNLRTE